jgi:isoleucyl-tRNA synthetase
VWADWASPYITLQPEYEAAQLRVFGKMFLNGHIYRCVCEVWKECCMAAGT